MHQEFEDFVNSAYPEPIEICGIAMTHLEALKRMPEHYEGIYNAWLENCVDEVRCFAVK